MVVSRFDALVEHVYTSPYENGEEAMSPHIMVYTQSADVISSQYRGPLYLFIRQCCRSSSSISTYTTNRVMVVAAGPLHGRHKARIAPAGSSNQERDSGKDGRALVLASSRFAHEGKKISLKEIEGQDF
jgi:hypothetical protein